MRPSIPNSKRVHDLYHGEAIMIYLQNLTKQFGSKTVLKDVFKGSSLTRLVLEGFLLNVLLVSGWDAPPRVPPTPAGGFPRPV